MGLNTSHGAYDGSYGGFHNFRVELARVAGLPPLESMEYYGGNIPWSSLEETPLMILLLHSDSDGEISWGDCKLLADYLTTLLDKFENVPEEYYHYSYQYMTQKFIERLYGGI